MIIVAVPAYVVPMVPSYRMLLYAAFFLGMAGSSFAVGSDLFPAGFHWKDRGPLGIYGLGNIGQSAAVFLGPVLAVAWAGRKFFEHGGLLVIWGIAFFLLAHNSPRTVRLQFGRNAPTSLTRTVIVVLSFLLPDFRWICCISIYLPVLLKDQFGLKPADAGFRTAGFVVLATWLATRRLDSG